jgi:hypothetical protein
MTKKKKNLCSTQAHVTNRVLPFSLPQLICSLKRKKEKKSKEPGTNYFV